MITPADIQNKEFSKGMRGYSIDEVDMFLDAITLDLEKLIKENLNLKAQVAMFEKEQNSIAGSDLTVKETLETAKSLMDDLSVSAEKRADILVKNAEMDATIIIKEAKLKAEQITDRAYELTKTYKNFKNEYLDFIERCQRNFENMDAHIDTNKLDALISETKLQKKIEDNIEENLVEEKKATLEHSPVEEMVLKDQLVSDFDQSKKTVVRFKRD